MKSQSNNINKTLMLQIQKVAEIKRRGNFRILKNELGEAELKKLLLKLYPRYTLPEIESITNVPDSTLGHWFNLLKIPRKRWHIKTIASAGSRDHEEIVNDGKEIRKKATVKVTPDLAYLIGFTLGDGSVQKYMVEVFNKDLGLYEHLSTIIRAYGNVTEDRRANGLWRLRLSSGKIANLIKKNKEIDEDTISYIFKRNTLAKSFVAAFWDAEGRVARSKYNYFHIYLYNTNEYLLDVVGQFLKSQGIGYSMHSRTNYNRVYLLKGRLVRSRKPLHRISIPKKFALRWAKEIGVHMMHSTKKKAVKQILS